MSTTPKRLDKYELVERLGHGGVAEVWKAQDTQLQRFVAIKLLHPDLRENPQFLTRFQREARLIASLHHPNIVQIHDFQVVSSPESGDSSLAYMVMEYIEGKTLADYIQQTSARGQIPSPVEIVNLFTSISLAVDYAHQKNMIHRDIKPANILLDANNTARNPMGEPMLTDFGVARMLDVSSNTATGAQLGTPLYISPEQARGYPGNERSDIYSLGVILYEMVTGMPPFRGDQPVDVISQHLNEDPTPPALINPQIPPALSLVILRSLSKDPNARFESAASLTAAIANALGVPVPEALGQPTFPLDPTDMPTQMARPAFSVSNPPSGAGVSSSGPYGNLAASQPMPSNPSAPGFTPLLVYQSQDSAPTAAPPLPAAPSAPPYQTPLPETPPQPTPPELRTQRRRPWLYVAVVSLVIAALLGVLAGYLFIFQPGILQPTPPPANTSVVGHAFFVSSGLLHPGSAQGIADQLQIDLQNIPSPATGKSYYAWLLGDKTPGSTDDLVGERPFQPPLLLTNNLPVENGNVRFLFQGDQQHNNLISVASRLLITEEQSGQTPNAPSNNPTEWRYYAAIPQAPIPGATPPGATALLHIRHLFYNETSVKVLGLPGGLDVWLLKNTEKILEWSISARDNWHGAETSESNVNLMRDQFIRMLFYLDGTPNVHLDLPADTPRLTEELPAKVALLTVDPKAQSGDNRKSNPPGTVDHIQLHISAVSKAPDMPPELVQVTSRILDAMNNTKVWLQQVRNDAVQLYKLDNEQLKQQLAGDLLNDLVTQITYAYIGQLDPTTNQTKPGVLQAHYDIQLLASFTLTKNVPKSL